jgi:hypothetical protein
MTYRGIVRYLYIQNIFVLHLAVFLSEQISTVKCHQWTPWIMHMNCKQGRHAFN